jgi:hypothetical protein
LTVWHVVGRMQAHGYSSAEAAEQFDLPLEAVLEAVDYYQRHVARALRAAPLLPCSGGRLHPVSGPRHKPPGGSSSRKASNVRACAYPMGPPGVAAVDDLGQCRAVTAPDLDDIWTVQGYHSPTLGHADHVLERGAYDILSASHGQVTEVTNAHARRSMNVAHGHIPADTPE